MSKPNADNVPDTIALPSSQASPPDEVPATLANSPASLPVRKVVDQTLVMPPEPDEEATQPGPATRIVPAQEKENEDGTQVLSPREAASNPVASPAQLAPTMEVPATRAGEPLVPDTLQGSAPATINRPPSFSDVAVGPIVTGYEILGELGRGGMGVVYKARQLGLNRTVAIKMILSGGHAGRGDLERFRAEAEAVAKLQHPNIVQIYEVGTQDGRPFFSLEFCEGGSLAARLHSEPLPPNQSAALVEVLARAMQAAHDKGIIHRDLKPANVLLGAVPTGSQLSPTALPFGTPKITDFGLAKNISEESSRTQSGAILGTPNYMAPEQAAGKIRDVGPSADIYALGAILYECLTGRTPFKGETPWDTIEQVLNQDPLPPSRLRNRVPRDLEIICLKCLRKEPKKRYPTAGELADDLRRFLNRDPIKARPVGNLERVWRWARRQPLAASLLGLLLVVIVGGVLGLSFLYVRAELGWKTAKKQRDAADEARQDAEEAEKRARQDRDAADRARAKADRAKELQRRVSYAAQMNLAQTALQENLFDRATNLLMGWKGDDLRGFEWRYLKAVSESGLRLREHTNLVSCVSFSPRLGEKRMASASLDHTIKIWDAETGKKLFDVGGHDGPVRCLTYSPDGALLASGGEDKVVRLWNAETGKPLGKLEGHTDTVHGVAFSGDSRHLASASEDGTVRLWNVEGLTPGLVLRGHRGGVLAVAFSDDGRLVASGGWDRTARLWDVAPGKEKRRLDGHKGWVWCVAFDRDGKRLATGGWDKTVKVWDVSSDAAPRTFKDYTSPVRDVCFSQDGQRLATLSIDRTIKVWDLLTGQVARTGTATGVEARGVSFSADGQLLVSVHFDYSGTALGTDALRVLEGHGSSVHAVAFRPPGGQSQSVHRLASAGAEGKVRVWDPDHPSDEPLVLGAEDSLPVRCVAFDTKGALLAAGGEDGLVHLWGVETGRELRSLHGHTGWIMGVAFQPNGNLLASASEDGTIRLWDLTANEPSEGQGSVRRLEGHKGTVHGVCFSPDGKRLASAGQDGTVRVWDVETRKEVLTLPGAHQGKPVRSVTFSPDGHTLASGGWDNDVALWDADTGTQRRRLHGHTYGVTSVCFSPDGKRLASGSGDRTVKLWDVETGRELLTLQEPAGGITGVAFSPDGNRLAASSWDQKVRVWSAPRDH
jgi:WD40 repeat protein